MKMIFPLRMNYMILESSQMMNQQKTPSTWVRDIKPLWARLRWKKQMILNAWLVTSSPWPLKSLNLKKGKARILWVEIPQSSYSKGIQLLAVATIIRQSLCRVPMLSWILRKLTRIRIARFIMITIKKICANNETNSWEEWSLILLIQSWLGSRRSLIKGRNKLLQLMKLQVLGIWWTCIIVFS